MVHKDYGRRGGTAALRMSKGFIRIREEVRGIRTKTEERVHQD